MNTNGTCVCLAGVVLLAVGALGGTAEPPSSTIPIALDHERMTVAVEFPRAGGGVRAARAWVDSGGTGLLVTESLARDLGIDVPAMPAGGGQSVPTTSPAPVMRLGGVALDVTHAPMGTVIEALRGKPGATRILLIERDGKRVTIRATVVRLP